MSDQPPTTDRERGAMIKLCGLWLGKTKDGRKYLSGNATYSSRFMAFPNSFKAKDTDPDYILYVSEREHEQKPNGGGADPLDPDAPPPGSGAAAPADASQQPGDAAKTAADGDAGGSHPEDDIPF